MRLIDANVILRYMLNDHEEVAQKARAVIMEGACTTVEVLAEVVYVLRGVYKAQREDISEWIACLLDDITIDNRQAVQYALRVFGETSLDFVDCILIGYNRIMGQRVFSFDKKLNRLLSSETIEI